MESSGLKKYSQKRQDYIEWQDYFMSVAFLAAKRSKDPVTQVGACIVNENNIIIGIGYNGFPRGCNDDDFPWGKNPDDKLDSKYFYVCHAEMNAILNLNCSSAKNATMYVGLFPCNECAKLIIQSQIKNIIYMSDKYANKKETIASKMMFDAAKVKYTQYTPTKKRIVIDFTEIDWNNMLQYSSNTPFDSPKSDLIKKSKNVQDLLEIDNAEKQNNVLRVKQ